MKSEKFEYMCKCMIDSFLKIAKEMADLKFNLNNNLDPVFNIKKTAIIVGIVGANPGRIQLETNETMSQTIAEKMNGETLNNPLEVYFSLAEFANIFSGNGLTVINNQFPGSQLRLTPPSIFVGESLELTTPNIEHAKSVLFDGEDLLRIDIGFKGE